MNIAVILAGGIGERAQQSVPKQFISINSKPLLVYTLEQFEKAPEIDRICVVTLPKYITAVEKYSTTYSISKMQTVTVGGKTGLESLYNGLVASDAKSTDLIVIHDGVRPFVTQQIIADNLQVAQKYGLALAATACVETLVHCQSQNNYSTRMIARDGLFRIQTPQTFRADILHTLLDDIKDWHSIKEPSIFALFMKYGGKIYISPSTEKNIKITYVEDVAYFKNLFSVERKNN